MLSFLNKWKEAPIRKAIAKPQVALERPPVPVPAPAAEPIKTVRRGVLTPARCHTPGCATRLRVTGLLRSCEKCGAAFALGTVKSAPRDDGQAIEVDFYDGRRIRILQMSTPAGWTRPF